MVVGEAVERGDWEEEGGEGALFEFCPHGDRASLGVAFCEPFATEQVAVDDMGVVDSGEEMEEAVDEEAGRDEVDGCFTGGNELGFDGFENPVTVFTLAGGAVTVELGRMVFALGVVGFLGDAGSGGCMYTHSMNTQRSKEE